jgi:D-tyrosyl-tRNA(Tyr) deacylase
MYRMREFPWGEESNRERLVKRETVCLLRIKFAAVLFLISTLTSILTLILSSHSTLMRAVVQRVKRARVVVHNETCGTIGEGVLVLLGVEQGDSTKDVDYIVSKIALLRIFEDCDSKMNLSLKDVQGEVMVVSQFTLLGDVRKGRRPSFSRASSPQEAEAKYINVVEALKREGLKVEKGEFQADMEVELVNSGPVTILLDSRKVF